LGVLCILARMVAADYVCAVGAVAKATAQDATQRGLLARGDGLPAATLALHCLFSALADHWSCKGPGELEPLAFASFAGGSDGGSAAGVPLPEGCSEWREADLVEGSTLVCRVLRNCVPEIDHDNMRVRRASTQGMQLLLWLVSAACRHASGDAAKLELLMAAALQALGNAVTSSARLATEVWEGAWPRVLTEVAMAQGARCQGVVAMIVYNALRTDSARQAAFAHDESAGDVLAALLGTTYSARAQVCVGVCECVCVYVSVCVCMC